MQSEFLMFEKKNHIFLVFKTKFHIVMNDEK